jgi:secretion/DNA translocation related CpaE-like protein
LAALTDSALRDELDRVAAAVGVRVVHAGGGSPVSRKTWSAAAAVVLDQAAADRCGQAALPRRAHASVLTATEAATATWAAAIAVGAQHVLRLPDQEGELIRELAEAAESARDDGLCGEVVAVIGGCGGAGASLFAVALAQAATDALVVDLDPWGGGIDLLVGGETTPGLRWPDLALRSGRLNWSAVREALPRHRGISLLSGTGAGTSWTPGRWTPWSMQPPRGSHSGWRPSPSAHRCHPNRAGYRRSRCRGQPMRCTGVHGDRDDRSGTGHDQSQSRVGCAGTVAGGIAGG